MLGDIIRLSPALLEEIRTDPSAADDRVTSFRAPERLELDWEWKLLALSFAAESPTYRQPLPPERIVTPVLR